MIGVWTYQLCQVFLAIFGVEEVWIEWVEILGEDLPP